MSNQSEHRTMDEYIAAFPQDVREILTKIRMVIREVAPEAEETIKYRIPTYVLHGNLVHFAVFKSHISLFPAPSGIEAFLSETAAYRTGKGTLQFPLDQPIPYELIRRIVKFRMDENLAKAAAKSKRKK